MYQKHPQAQRQQHMLREAQDYSYNAHVAAHQIDQRGKHVLDQGPKDKPGRGKATNLPVKLLIWSLDVVQQHLSIWSCCWTAPLLTTRVTLDLGIYQGRQQFIHTTYDIHCILGCSPTNHPILIGQI